jgi:ubiquinone/menaquinone biosynthesis C-methylase UbiE
MNGSGYHKEGGKSSFGLVNTPKLFDSLELKPGITFLDLGSGRGEYTLAAAKLIGESGNAIAVDKWEEGINHLTTTAIDEGIPTIKAYASDISVKIPVQENTVDICLMVAVLHGLIKNEIFRSTIHEVLRVLKSGGKIAVIEWKKVNGPPGPSIDIRLSELEIEKIMNPYGFIKDKAVDLGEYFYLTTFLLNGVMG